MRPAQSQKVTRSRSTRRVARWSGGSWTFLLALARDPEVRLREVVETCVLTERTVEIPHPGTQRTPQPLPHRPRSDVPPPCRGRPRHRGAPHPLRRRPSCARGTTAELSDTTAVRTAPATDAAGAFRTRRRTARRRREAAGATPNNVRRASPCARAGSISHMPGRRESPMTRAPTIKCGEALRKALDQALRVPGGSWGSTPVVAEASLIPLGRAGSVLLFLPRLPVLLEGRPWGLPASSLDTVRPGPLAGAYSSAWKERWALGLCCCLVSSTSGGQPCCSALLEPAGPLTLRGLGRLRPLGHNLTCCLPLGWLDAHISRSGPAACAALLLRLPLRSHTRLLGRAPNVWQSRVQDIFRSKDAERPCARQLRADEG
ncbi:hypothetical protein JYK04_00844 [Streptomyces nojiriensis]|nr:hypothetical protein JYK04_00844 [Streptomyces nojiriensis]